METIEDIVAEMRKDMPRVVDAKVILRNYAGRIEAAVKHHFRDATETIPHEEVAVAESATTTPTCDKSSQVGDAAKIRAALEAALPIMRACPFTHYNTTEVDKVVVKMESALAKPPRNCDKCLTPKDAMLAHLEEVYEGEKVEFGDYEWSEFVKWLFAEAKGERK